MQIYFQCLYSVENASSACNVYRNHMSKYLEGKACVVQTEEENSGNLANTNVIDFMLQSYCILLSHLSFT